jgi:hypothetical protein
LQVAASVCSFTFADGRRCRTPRCADHSHLCYFHAKKEAQAAASEKIGREIATWFTGEILTACDLSGALGELFSCTAQGKIKLREAATFAYLGQTLLQTIKIAQHEYINAHGADTWRRVIRYGTRTPALPQAPQPATTNTPAPKPEPQAPSNQQSGAAVPAKQAQ